MISVSASDDAHGHQRGYGQDRGGHAEAVVMTVANQPAMAAAIRRR